MDEAAAWQRFQRGKNASSRWSLARWWWFAPALGGLAILATHIQAKRAHERDALSLTPEPITASAPGAISASPAESARRIPPLASTLPAVGRSSAPAHGAHASIVAAHSPSSTVIPNSAPSAEITDAECRRLAREGKFEPAVSCFEVLGQGSGTGADVALYEAARISSERLHEPARALALLERHARQFPDSALRGENAWLRVVSLERAGDWDAALRESEQLLASPVGRALAAKIHLLRGRIYRQNRGDCAHAVQEYVALLGEPDSSGDEAELARAGCLERLGEQRAAIEAYERYLRRSDPRNPALAQERLQALGSEPTSSEGASQ